MFGYCKRYTLYIGLADQDSGQQNISCERTAALVSKVCENYGAAFSIAIQRGGYFHNNGRFVDETSLALQLIGLKKRHVNEIAKDLCCFLRQECVLVACDWVRNYTISEGLNLDELGGIKP